MKRFFPVLLTVMVVVLFFQPFFVKQLLPVPSDTIIGLYHPFRDLYAAQYPRGIPYKNFLITDPVLQQYPWRHLAIGLEQRMQLPLWNPYNFAGMPLLANLQSSAFYPLNSLFFLLPFSFAWTLLILFQPLLACLFMYLYLRNLKLSQLSSLFGGIVFAFSGFSLVWLEWGTIVQTGLWLPLVLLAVDKLLQSQRKSQTILWSILFLAGLCFSFFAGHLQTFFYEIIVTILYLVLKISQKKTLKYIGVFVILFFIFLALTAIQWIPLLQLIQLSARGVDHVPFTTPGWFIPWQNLAQFIAPDFFGNPATLNYWGIWNYMEFSGYVGLFPLLLAVFSFLFIRMKKVYFFGTLLVGSLFLALPSPVAQIPFLLHIPFIETSQPTRLLFIVDFSLSVLAAIGISSLQSITRKIWISFGVITSLLLCLWLTVFFHARVGMLVEQAVVAKQNLIFPSIILVSVGFILGVSQIIKLSKRYAKILPVLIIFITCVDLFRFGYKFTPFTPAAYLFPQTKVLAYLKDHIGSRRIMETSREIFSPNIATMYSIQSVDGYDPLYLMRYGEYIAASERGKPDINPPFGFNRIITPQNYNSHLIDLLGVKYVLSLQELKDTKLRKVFEEGETKIYENTDALPRVFFVDKIITVSSKQDAMTNLFAVQKDLSSVAVVEAGTSLDKEYSTGTSEIMQYSPNEVSIKTHNNAKGFLVLTDVYYPTWHVFIDGKESNIFVTDFTFRGAEIPAGDHTVIFRDTLW